ncbi:MAG: hypothetical protein NVSMB66_4810 [Candidatus Doudnabacteria bacterium]
MFRKMASFALVLLMALFTLMAPTQKALAQDEETPNNTFTRTVAAQILDSRIYRELLNQGYSPSHTPNFKKIYNGNSLQVTYTLRGGYDYHFLGKCDQDCGDIDLKLYDSNGNLVDSDIQPDDYPWVHHNVDYTGTYTLKMIMADCRSSAGCWMGVVAVRK